MTDTVAKQLEQLETLQQEYRTKKEVLKDTLASDPELMELTEEAKEGKQRVTLQRQALMNEPENRQIQADIQELAKEIKEVKEQLGDELVAYFMKNQTLEYTDSTGTKRKFRVSARFVGKNSEEA